MKSSIIIIGVILIVVGALTFLVPLQEIKADTRTIDAQNGDVDARSSTARVTIPQTWSFSILVLGFLLLLIGAVVPGSSSQRTSEATYEKVVKNKPYDDNNARVVQHKVVRHTNREED